MPQLTASLPTLPVALTTNFERALPAMTGAVRFRPSVLEVLSAA